MAVYPEKIGKYKIDSLVAKGGMGAVFKAMHPTLNRYVIIKKLTLRGSSSIVERFKREARILIDFKNDHIVRVFDHFKEGNSHYIVLEYVDGMALDQLIKKQRMLSNELALLIFLDACKALRYAHSMGVIHRDIKPGNILISKKGAVKLADFGIATEEGEQESSLTREGMTLGTPSYIPPEQIENSKNVDKRADIYAMGIMLYEMLTGKKPYPGNLSPDTIVQIQKGKYQNAVRINPHIHPFVNRLIRKLIKPDPRKRFQNMETVIKIVERYLRRRPVEEIRSVLVDLIQSKIKEEPVYRKLPRKRLLCVAICMLVLCFTAAAALAWEAGYFYRYLMPSRYGAIELQLRIPKTLLDLDDVHLRAQVFLNDGDTIPELKDATPVFKPASTAEADPFHSFITGPLYLSPGNYRVKISSGVDVFWESFTVSSFKDMRSESDPVQILNYRLGDHEARPVTVHMDSYDVISGSSLQDIARYSVFYKGRWILLSEVPEDAILSGSVWRFKVDADGYTSEVFSLLIAKLQDTLMIRAGLMPLTE